MINQCIRTHTSIFPFAFTRAHVITGKSELAVSFDEEIYYPCSTEKKQLFLEFPERYVVDHVPTWPRRVVLFVGGSEETAQSLVQSVAARLSSAESAQVKVAGQPVITYCCPPPPQFPEVSFYFALKCGYQIYCKPI